MVFHKCQSNLSPSFNLYGTWSYSHSNVNWQVWQRPTFQVAQEGTRPVVKRSAKVLFNLKLMASRTALGKSQIFRILGEWTQSTPQEDIKSCEGSSHRCMLLPESTWTRHDRNDRTLTDWTLVVVMSHSYLQRVLLEKVPKIVSKSKRLPHIRQANLATKTPNAEWWISRFPKKMLQSETHVNDRTLQ